MKKGIKKITMLLVAVSIMATCSLTVFAAKDVLREIKINGEKISYHESNAPKIDGSILDEAEFYNIYLENVKSNYKTVGSKLLYIKGNLDSYYYNSLRIFDENGKYFSENNNPIVVNKINKNNDAVISISDNALFRYNTEIYKISPVKIENNKMYVEVSYFINEHHVLHGYEAKLGNYIGDVFYHTYGGETLYYPEDAYTFGQTRFYIEQSDIGKSLKLYLNGQYIDTIKINK